MVGRSILNFCEENRNGKWYLSSRNLHLAREKLISKSHSEMQDGMWTLLSKQGQNLGANIKLNIPFQ